MCYFATSHGKGVADGIGGNCKSMIRTKSMSKSNDKIVVQNAEDFAAAVSLLMPMTTAIYVSKNDVNSMPNPFLHVTDVKSIFKSHAVEFENNTVQLYKNLDFAEPHKIYNISESGVCQLKKCGKSGCGKSDKKY